MGIIREVDEKGELVEPAVQTEAPTELESQKNVTAPVFAELGLKAIQEAVGLETDGDKYKYQGKVETLMEWVKTQVPEMTPEAVKSKIRELEIKVGSPPISEKRVSYLARYAYLMMEENKIKQERKGMEV